MAKPIPLAASAYPIKAVTVFTSHKAEVVRTFTVDLAAGQNELAITGLPSCIDTDSARVTGLGDAVLFDVVCTVADARDENAQLAARDDVLKTLERRRDVLQGEKALRGHAADVLIQYGLSLTAENTPMDGVTTFMNSMLDQGATTLEQVSSIDEQIAELEKKLEKEKYRLEKERLKAPALGRVSAIIMAKHAGKIEVTLTYMVSSVEWSPTYDLRATTEEGKPLNTVSFHYRASIKQNTGEDWRDTAISVSTASPGSWTNIPSLRSMKIAPAPHTGLFGQKPTGHAFLGQTQNNNVNTNTAPAISGFGQSNTGVFNNNTQQPKFSFALVSAPQAANPMFSTATRDAPSTSSGLFHPGAQAAPSTGMFGSSQPFTSASSAFGQFGTTFSPPNDPSDGWTSVEPTETPGPNVVVSEESESAWAETKAVVTEGAVASAFHIEGKCTIPSEPTPHKVAIAILSFEAKVNYIAVPRSAPVAFLECEVKNTSEYRLLPGPVNIFLDNSPASKTSIQDVSPEEVFKCILGPDPSLRIKCTRLPPVITSSGSAYAAQTTVTTYKICTHVHNTHSFAIKTLLVRDAAPVRLQLHENGSVPGINVVLKRPVGLGEAATTGMLVNVSTSMSGKSMVKVRWAHEGHDKDGKYVWVVDVGAGEEVKLEAEYEVRAPTDYKWMLRETPF